MLRHGNHLPPPDDQRFPTSPILRRTDHHASRSLAGPIGKRAAANISVASALLPETDPAG
jgi:hypothetical protein